MRTTTKQDPTCYHGAIEYLAELEKTDKLKILVFKSLDEMRRPVKHGKFKGKLKLIYPSHRIIVYDEEDKPHPYINHAGLRFDALGIIPKEFHVPMLKTFDDFQTKLEPAGKYRDSLGGGWYSDVPMFKHNGNYFAMMECSCG